LGRGAATTFPRNLEHADCFVVMGSNMAENHPVAFRWPMRARVNGATLIHVDPRFTRTSAMCDVYAPIRAGSDIAFLGGLINYVINSERWHTEPFFREYVANYTNAPTIITDEFQGADELDGIFSGLIDYAGGHPEWPYNGFVGMYDNTSWRYEGRELEGQGQAEAYSVAAGEGAQEGDEGQEEGQDQPGRNGGPRGPGEHPGPPFDWLVRELREPEEQRDPTLEHPNCVFQIVRRHFARYTVEMVERVTGCPRDTFLRVAEALLQNSGPDRTSAFAYAVAWTQHTNGVQTIGCCALLQLLLGNIGRPGGGIVALRGHASIQGSTDLPTLYHSIHGYMAHPSTLKDHETLEGYLREETDATTYYANTPKFLVSYLKSMYGPAATVENDFGYGWHPRILGDHSHMPMFVAMAEGRVKGMLCIGQNPATSLNAKLERAALGKLDWLVVKDNWLLETANFWKTAPEVTAGEIRPEDIGTEVFFLPSAQIAEEEGSFTNTQRLLQWHFAAAPPPGDCRSDNWFTYHLGKRLKRLYEGSTLARDQGFLNLTWDYESHRPQLVPGEPDAELILKEINGYFSDEPGRHLAGPDELADDGSTTCASWLYCGCFPAPDRNLPAARQADPPGEPGAHLGWGWAWPANRRVLYNRASADPQGNPWSERKRWVWWDGERWAGYDTPDFPPEKAPGTPRQPGGIGLDAHSGSEPFIMKDDGRGWLFVPAGLIDGPLPVHYEPAESPVRNPLHGRQNNPTLKYWEHGSNPLAPVGDERFPHVITTYRLTEHYLAGGMSRWLPWLAQLQPELFIELSPELAEEKGIRNLDRVRVTSPRGSVTAKALVTRRVRPLTIDGRRVHQVGMPWHWGWEGLSVGDVVNDLTSLVGDPNVSIHEGKAFVCNIEKA
jgi:formate dehydrogenase major subunit